jgi:hypothetical protein
VDNDNINKLGYISSSLSNLSLSYSFGNSIVPKNYLMNYTNIVYNSRNEIIARYNGSVLTKDVHGKLLNASTIYLDTKGFINL